MLKDKADKVGGDLLPCAGLGLLASQTDGAGNGTSAPEDLSVADPAGGNLVVAYRQKGGYQQKTAGLGQCTEQSRLGSRWEVADYGENHPQGSGPSPKKVS